MAVIKPFSCVRPTVELASTVAALPYDVYSSAEARAFVSTHPKSFLAIDRSETAFPEDVDMYSKEVYEKAGSMLREWIENGTFLRDEEKCYYLYELTMNGRAQTGIVACASIDDYLNNVIKKHENTRADKELDRINHVKACSAQTGPIFLAYKAQKAIQEVVASVKQEEALYDFVSEDGIRHRVFRIADVDRISVIETAFAGINHIYIADGHHRAASAVKAGLDLRAAAKAKAEADTGVKENTSDTSATAKAYTDEEEFNYFLSVLFPDEELMIMDYNRVVKDLNGRTSEEFLAEVSNIFDVTPLNGLTAPKEKGTFTMYLDETWYLCRMNNSAAPDNMAASTPAASADPVEALDVSILQKQLLTPVLGIGDPKTDKRIDFVGGIRGLEELERRCKTDCKVAFAMYPTSIQELFDVADAGLLMPPKSTWFEPKLRSGIFVHEI